MSICVITALSTCEEMASIHDLAKNLIQQSSELERLNAELTKRDQMICNLERNLVKNQDLLSDVSDQLLQWKLNPQVVHADEFITPRKKTPKGKYAHQKPLKLANHFDGIRDELTPSRSNTTHQNSTNASLIDVSPEMPKPRPQRNRGIKERSGDDTYVQNEAIDLLIVGTSNVKDIVPGKMFSSKKCVVQTLKEKTIKGATEFISTNKLRPKVAVFHVAGNSLAKTTTADCIDHMENLLSVCSDKMPDTKLFVSLPFARQLHSKDESTWYNSKRIAFNNAMIDRLGEGRTIVHHNISPNNRSRTIKTDGVHLSEFGVRLFVRKVKSAINPLLV